MENRSLVSRLIGGPENVRAAECTRRFNAKIGHLLFHSLFQRDHIVGRSLYETLPTKMPTVQTFYLTSTESLPCKPPETVIRLAGNTYKFDKLSTVA